MSELFYTNQIFIEQTQNLQVGDRFLVRSDTPPDWINAMDKYKGKWLTVFKRTGKGATTVYTDEENEYGAFYPTDIAEVITKPPALCVKSPNLPSV